MEGRCCSASPMKATVLGLDHDYQTLQKKNADGYELFLGDLLLTHYGKDLSRFLRFSFHEVDGKQVCQVIIEPAPRAAWVKEGNEEHLYVRAGNSTRRLTTKEAIDYSEDSIRNLMAARPSQNDRTSAPFGDSLVRLRFIGEQFKNRSMPIYELGSALKGEKGVKSKHLTLAIGSAMRRQWRGLCA